MAAFESFTLFYAKSLAQNTAANADLKITNADGIKLVYCIPISFDKRQTDTSNAQSEGKTSPDTGTAKAGIELDTDAQTEIVKQVVAVLESEGVALDVGSYRDAPPGFRIWGGATVENSDLEALLPWFDWAYQKAMSR